MTSWRSAHRSRSHDSAHAADESTHQNHTIDHPLVPSGPAAPLIVTQPALNAAVDELRAAGSFAYDTEFIGELTYHPLLCLIQVATSQRVLLIDPMAGLDLRGFWELLADASVEKIVHAGEQDVEPVARNLGGTARARNVIDTQVAAGFSGMAYPVALSKLVLELIGVKLGKGLTFTHWDQRPLSEVQLRYAADDVRYLPATWDTLQKRLIELCHREWATAECDEMCDPSQFGFHPDKTYQRVRGIGTLTSAGVAVLRELTIWRDAAARAANVPARALMRDEILIDLSRSPVKSVDKLDRVRGLPRPVEMEHGAAIVEATLRAISSPRAQETLPRVPEPSPTERFRADSLYAAACAVCAARSVDAALLASRQEIGEFFRLMNQQDKAPQVEESPLLRGWRREALGDPLQRFLRGEPPQDVLEFLWRDGRLQSENSAGSGA